MNKLIATLVASMFAMGAFAADTMPAAPAAEASAPAKTAHKKMSHHKKKAAATAPADAASK